MISKELVTGKRQELYQIADQLLDLASQGAEQQTPIHEVEAQAFRALLQAGHAKLRLVIDLQGDGDLGEEYQLPDRKTLHRSQEPHTRPYVSVFGELTIERYVYAQREGQKIKFAAVDGLVLKQANILPFAAFCAAGSVEWDREPASAGAA